jgi:hypothetical protein
VPAGTWGFIQTGISRFLTLCCTGPPEKTQSGKDVAATLTGSGFTHILMSYAGFNLWLKEAASDHDRQVLRQFFESHVEVLFSKDGYALLAIFFCKITESLPFITQAA